MSLVTRGGALAAISLIFALAGCGKLAGGDHWLYEEPTDNVTHNKTYDAKRTVALEGGGHVEMTADCRELSIPFVGTVTFVGIEMVFFDKDDKALDVDTAGFDDNGQGALRYTTKDGAEETLGVQLIHTNEIQLRGLNTNDATNDFAKTLLENNQAKEFVDAQFARLEIPLLDGQKPVIDLLPQDEDLRKVVRQCLPAVFQAAPAPAPQATSAAPPPAAAPPVAPPSAPAAPPSGCPAADQAALDNEKRSIDGDEATSAPADQGFIYGSAPLRDGPDVASCVTHVLDADTFVHIEAVPGGKWLSVTVDQPSGAAALRGYVWGGLVKSRSSSGATEPAPSTAPPDSSDSEQGQQQP